MKHKRHRTLHAMILKCWKRSVAMELNGKMDKICEHDRPQQKRWKAHRMAPTMRVEISNPERMKPKVMEMVRRFLPPNRP